MVREALTVIGLAVLVSGTLGALIYLGADALTKFLFCDRNHARASQAIRGQSDYPLVQVRRDFHHKRACYCLI
jgi:hypothetical protein